jgi:hypothetical protein
MIKNATISSGVVDLLTAPSGQVYIVTTMFLCNTNAFYGDVINMHIIQSGEAVGNGNLVINSYPVAAADTEIFNLERITLQDGDRISANSLSGLVTATLGFLIG